MGANRHNKYANSRRFSVCYKLASDSRYIDLLCCYQLTKLSAQSGKAGHIAHTESIKSLKEYLSKAQVYFKHS